MAAFRQVLHESLDLSHIDPARLVGKYIPNVTGKPFAIDKGYFEEVYEATGSERLRREVLDCWAGWEGRVEGERTGEGREVEVEV